MNLIQNIQNFLNTKKKYENLIIISGIIIFLAFTVGSQIVHAQLDPKNSVLNVQDLYKDVRGKSVKETGESNPNIQMTQDNAITSILISAVSVTGSSRIFTLDTSIKGGGLVSFVDGQIVAMIHNQPKLDVPKYLAQQWVPGQQNNNSLYAASDGYTHLIDVGLDGLWSKTSVIADIMFVIVLIIAGFMIMFRQKIGGQVAITIFNAIPNVIVGLILVAFSFAIIGMILNLSVLATNVIGGVLGGGNFIKITDPFSLFQLFMSPDYWKSVADFTGFSNPLLSISVGLATLGITAGIQAIATLLILLISLIAVLYVSVRVYFVLIQAYLSIIMDTILAPIIIAFGSIPGNESMRSEVFKRVLKNALVFPGVFLFINLGSYVLSNNINIQFPYGLTTGNWASGGAGSDMIGAFLKVVISIGLFYLAAEVPVMLNDFIQLNGGKNMAEALGSAKKSLSKLPLVGSIFN